MKLIKVNPLKREILDEIGLKWHTDENNTDYISDEIVVVSSSEVEAYYEAANELYDMYVQAAQYIIDNELFHEVGIPFNLVELVKDSWENEVHWHLYGRFDLAGGIDGKPIKLIEFNADTPTMLFETAVIQWALLKSNGLDEEYQFNDISEAIKENFRRLVTLDEETESFDENYEGWKILFSSILGSIEDENTTKLLQNLAYEAGFETDFAYAEDVNFSDEDGIFYNEKNFEYWFKLIPWESIAIEEGELAIILKNIIKNQKAIILNPAYTLLFQSKGILKILWDLFPNHPLLLESSFSPLKDKKQVKKPFLGREGANVSIIEKDGSVSTFVDGEYEDQRYLYQEFVEFNKDEKNQYYQAGVFFAFEACGLGYRKGGAILDNASKFAGHIIED